MSELTPIQRAVLYALHQAGNIVAYQRMLLALIKEDERTNGPRASLLAAIEHAAIRKALGVTD